MDHIFSIKIVTVDYYMSQPIPNLDMIKSEFRQSLIKSVPVIRIFGITKSKKKVCAQIHNVRMYIIIIRFKQQHNQTIFVLSIF